MSVPYAEVLGEPGVPSRFNDAREIGRYVAAGSPHGNPIYLGFGETWTEVAAPLLKILSAGVPCHAHGYVISQYGLPLLHRVLRSYIPRTHGLPRNLVVGRDFEVAVECSGTRNAMFDFGRLVLNETKTPARQPVVITATPGWGYEGVFAGLGYRSRHVPLRARDGYQPRWREFQRLLMGEDDVKLVIINAQHNPTAANWSESAVREIIRSSVAAGAAILLDDAYFAVHDPNVKPTSALRILLEELSALPPETRPIWLAVRSLGKQFHCNGWGIGAITGHPATVDRLVNQVRFERTFVNAVPLQYAMAAWLQDPASDLYLEQMRSEYYRKRCAVADYLADNLAYPPRAYYRGECTAFLRFEVPKRFSQLGAEDFRADCFRSTGVMLSLDSSPEQVSKAGMASKAPCVRIFLGPSLNHLLEGLDRLQQAGFQYQ